MNHRRIMIHWPDCSQVDWEARDWPIPGDVRRCAHGRLQRLEDPPWHTAAQGPGGRWWRDLSPIWTPILYRRALRAWNGDKR